MGVLLKHYLDGQLIYVCGSCKTHLTDDKYLMSKSFNGAHGRAYLFKKVINVAEGPWEDRKLLTGRHTVCDIYCIQCYCLMGWKYIKAFEKDQEYKTGSFILEKTLIKAIEQHDGNIQRRPSSDELNDEDEQETTIFTMYPNLSDSEGSIDFDEDPIAVE